MRSIGRSPPLVLVMLVTMAITSSAQVSPEQGTREQTKERLAKSTREAMIKLLGSPNANPSIGEEAKTFDRLVGTWDADLRSAAPTAPFSIKRESCCSAGSWMVTQYRTFGSAIRPRVRRNARSERRFGSSIRHLSNGASFL